MKLRGIFLILKYNNVVLPAPDVIDCSPFVAAGT
jgi:hypothetical protein